MPDNNLPPIIEGPMPPGSAPARTIPPIYIGGKSPEERIRELEDQYLLDIIGNTEDTIAKAQAGAQFMQSQGIDPVGETIIKLTDSGIGGLDEMIQTALKQQGAGSIIKLYIRQVTVTGLILNYAINLREEIDQNGNVGFRAELVGGTNAVVTAAGAYLGVKLLLAAIGTPGLLVAFTVGAVTTLFVSEGYNLLFKEKISEQVRKAYDEQTKGQTQQPEQPQTPAPDSAPSPDAPFPQMPDASGGILASIGGFFSAAADRIGGFLGMGGSNNGSMALASGPFGFGRIGFEPGSDLEKLLSQGLDKFTDKVAERLARNEGVLNNALGRTLTQNSGLFGDLLKKAKLGDLTGGLEDLFSSKNLGNIFGDFIGNAAAAGVGKLLGAGKMRTSVTSQESDRSREYARNWNLSRSQQAAMLAQMVQQGSRNM